MAVIDRIMHKISLNEGVTAELSDDGMVTFSGEHGSISREFTHQKVIITKENNGLLVSCEIPRKKEKALCGTWAAHLSNMNKGVSD